MKVRAKILIAVVLAAGFGASMLFARVSAQPANYSSQLSQPPEATTVKTMKELRQAENEAQHRLRQHPRNNTRYLVKRNQIQDLINRLKAGGHVDPREIDQALDPEYIR